MLFSTQIKTIFISSLIFATASFASAPVGLSNHVVPFQRTAHGLTFPCPKLQANEQVLQNLKTIIEKVKNNTLMNDDEILNSLGFATSSIIYECQCANYCRSNSLRPIFEQQLTAIAAKKFAKDQQMQYLNYGAGDMFQDLIIATKLAIAGHTNISIVLVDNYYADFFQMLSRDQNVVRPVRVTAKLGCANAIVVNNDIYYLSSYCSLLQNVFPELSIKITMFQNYEQALAQLSPQSSQIIFYVDLGPLKDMSPEDISKIPMLKYGIPSFCAPYIQDKETKKYVLNDYFKLAEGLLANGGCNCAITEKTAGDKLIIAPVFGQYQILDQGINLLIFNDFTMDESGKNKFNVLLNNRFYVSKNYQTGVITVRDSCQPYAPTPDFIQQDSFWCDLFDKGMIKCTAKRKESLMNLMLLYDAIDFGKHYCRLRKID